MKSFIRMWVADREFATPDVVIDGIKRDWKSGIFPVTQEF